MILYAYTTLPADMPVQRYCYFKKFMYSFLCGVTSDVAPRDQEHVDNASWANVAAETGSGSGPRQSYVEKRRLSRPRILHADGSTGDRFTRGRQGAPRCSFG